MGGFSVLYHSSVDRHYLEHEKLPEGAFLAASMAYVATWIITPIAQSLNFFSVLILLNTFLLCIAVAKICDAVNALGRTVERKPSDPVIAPPAKTLFLYGIAGQYQGQQLKVNQQPINIAHSPTLSNLVIPSAQLSTT